MSYLVARLSPSVLPVPLQWLLLLVCALGAGQLLRVLHVPASGFLGPMIVSILFAVAGTGVRMPKIAFKAGQGVIGLMAAHAISFAVLMEMAASWPIMLTVTVLTIAVSMLGGVLMVRYGNLPGTTAIWGSTPGAAAAMVAMAERYGVDARVVASMQYVRVVCVVLCGALASHFLAAPGGVSSAHVAIQQGWDWLPLIGGLLVIGVGVTLGDRIPAGALLIPLVLGTALHLAGWMSIAMPASLLTAAMAALGCYVGLRFDRPTVLYVVRRLPAMIACSMLLIALSAALAWPVSHWLDRDYLSVYLATSPGGLDSMAIIAVDSQADVSLVLAMQTLRLFAVILTGPYLVKKIVALLERRSA